MVVATWSKRCQQLHCIRLDNKMAAEQCGLLVTVFDGWMAGWLARWLCGQDRVKQNYAETWLNLFHKGLYWFSTKKLYLYEIERNPNHGFFLWQVIHSKSPRLGNKCKEWASNKWNILDGIAIVLFFVGLGLRLHSATRGFGHVVYCFDVVLWIMRLLNIFSVSKYMGPYVVMIGRMVITHFDFFLLFIPYDLTNDLTKRNQFNWFISS